MTKLAIEEMNPVRKEYLAYGRQAIDEDDIEAVMEVLRGDYLTTGPKVDEFEKNIAQYVGAKYAVAVTNGTAALHIAMLTAGISEGDEVLVSPLTFVASANCILYCGGKPVFVDIEPDTGNIDVNKIEEKITDKTKAIIAVDFAGHPVDIDKILEICKKHNLIFVEDSAHGLGSEYKGKKVGAMADMTMFSFHPVKPITTGEGGVITTNSEEYYKKLKLFRSHGITREQDQLINKEEGLWYYEQQFLGFNYRMPDINCALGISQLKKLDSFINRRREIVKMYNEAFKDIQWIITPTEKEYAKSGHHIYTIKIREDILGLKRKDVFSFLQRNNIGVNVHYLPVYLQPYYINLGYKKGICVNSELFYENIITLPLYPTMENQDINYVIECLSNLKNIKSK